MSEPVQSSVAPAAFDIKDFRRALGAFATGVTVITTRRANGDLAGLTANSFNSVSLSPPLVLWSLSLFSPNLPAFQETTHFAVNILAADQVHLSKQFSRSGIDKFAGVQWREGLGGIPILEQVAASLTCRNEFRYYGGDHIIFVGAVLTYEYTDARPLVFAGGQYVDIHPRSET
jgi:3-hydroxy-9,10-secoandrosta-1,3,5(10)-triene-9,17-dione monooxygenase reductase component